MKDFSAFVKGVEESLSGSANGKGYAQHGTADTDLHDFIEYHFSGHALGEIVSKCVRYQAKKNPEDLLKIAAWAYLLWQNEVPLQRERAYADSSAANPYSNPGTMDDPTPPRYRCIVGSDGVERVIVERHQ